MVEVECPCGCKFSAPPSKSRKFCSRDCFNRYRPSPNRPSGLIYKISRPNPGWFKAGLSGEQHPNWKGDEVGYQHLHRWIRLNKTKPEVCEHCREPKKLEWANRSHRYLRDLDDWIALCKSCHGKHDRGRMGIATAKYGAKQVRSK